MRTSYILTLLIVFCWSLGIAQNHVSERQVDIKFDYISISNFIDTLSTLYGVHFSYDSDLVHSDSLISINVAQTKILPLIKKVFKNGEVDVTLYLDQIIIRKSPYAVTSLTGEKIRISGIVFNAATNCSLPSVHVSTLNEPIGTVTNDQGQFDINIPTRLRNDTLVFSSIGFKRYNIPVNLCDSFLTIELVPETIQLPSINVVSLSARALLEKVIENRKVNYFNNPVALTAFFRESIKQDERYVQVLESLIDIYKPSYSNQVLERVKFIKGRKRDDVDSMKEIQFRLQGGPYLFSRLDVVRYLDFFPSANDESYQYSYSGSTFLEGQMVMKIDFKPVEDDGSLQYQGVMYIHSVNYALVRIDFEMTKNTIKKSHRYLIRKDQRNSRAKPYYARYMIDYRPYKDKWIINKVVGNIKVKIIDRKRHKRSNFEACSELLVTDLNSGAGEKIRYSESFKPNYILENEIQKSKNDAFWADYNIIKPDDDLEKLFDLIKK